jgi:hypothetical protein
MASSVKDVIVIVVIVLVVALVLAAFRRRRPRRLTFRTQRRSPHDKIKRAAAADVATVEHDRANFDPNSPGWHKDDL